MNEMYVRFAVKDFIDEHKLTWLDGVVHQGTQRVFSTISLTRLTPPQGGYHINISTRNPVIHYKDSMNSSVAIVDYTTYNVVIELADFILPQPDDETMYQTMVKDFFNVRDSIVNSLNTDLVTNNGKLTYDSTSYTVEPAFGININNSEEFIVNEFPIAYSSIELRVRGC
jgi:hypothetical protein